MSNLRKEQHEKALEMLRQGMTAGAVARATGYNKCYILEMARKNGISCGRSSIARCDEVIMSMAVRYTRTLRTYTVRGKEQKWI